MLSYMIGFEIPVGNKENLEDTSRGRNLNFGEALGFCCMTYLFRSLFQLSGKLMPGCGQVGQ
jgi:hypothetical protein